MATAPKKTSDNEQTDEITKPKKSKKKLIVILVAALLLLGGGGGAWWYFMGQNGNEAGAKKEKAMPPVFVTLEQFTINLQPEGGEHYLQVSMTLQVTAKEDVDQIKLYMPQIRSRVLLLLSGKKASEIATIEGKKKLSEEIMAQVNQPLTPQGKPQSVSNVFFTSFVIQ